MEHNVKLQPHIFKFIYIINYKNLEETFLFIIYIYIYIYIKV